MIGLSESHEDGEQVKDWVVGNCEATQWFYNIPNIILHLLPSSHLRYKFLRV